jgi:hypothetical protein
MRNARGAFEKNRSLSSGLCPLAKSVAANSRCATGMSAVVSRRNHSMKRASSASKTRSAALGAKRKPRRRLALAGARPAPAKRKSLAKAKPAAGRNSVVKPRTIAKRKAKPTSRPTAKTRSTARRTPINQSPVRRPRVKIPAYLLEGDVPVAPAVAGPGEKFALGPETPAAHFAAEAAHLPEAYGTGRLYVTPRDPHWIYVHWDIAPQEQFRHNARSVDRHLILRIHEEEVRERPVAEIHVHPESRHWFAHVECTETVYVTELGYYQTGRRWKSLATSAPAKTPADHVSTDATVEFATIPLELPFETMLGMLKEGAREKLPLARAIEQLRVSRESALAPPPEMSEWTSEQEQALAEFVARDRAAHVRPNSYNIGELLGRPVEGEISTTEIGEFDLFSFFGGAGGSSPFGGGPCGGNNFWFQVNAELIIHGATEPDATVTFAGKPIPLRPDGSFSFRFTFPDGQYELPVVAVSADGTDGRAAAMKFTRATELYGDVGAQFQDPALAPPRSENV